MVVVAALVVDTFVDVIATEEAAALMVQGVGSLVG